MSDWERRTGRGGSAPWRMACPCVWCEGCGVGSAGWLWLEFDGRFANQASEYARASATSGRLRAPQQGQQWREACQGCRSAEAGRRRMLIADLAELLQLAARLRRLGGQLGAQPVRLEPCFCCVPRSNSRDSPPPRSDSHRAQRSSESTGQIAAHALGYGTTC